MKKLSVLLSLLLILFLPSFASAQDNLQKIEVKESFWGKTYYYLDVRLNLQQLEAQLANVPETQPEVKKARGLYFPTMLLSGTGGYLVGYPIGSAMGGDNDPNWELAVAGSISVAIGMYLGSLSDKHYEKAVEIYNSYIY